MKNNENTHINESNPTAQHDEASSDFDVVFEYFLMQDLGIAATEDSEANNANQISDRLEELQLTPAQRTKLMLTAREHAQTELGIKNTYQL